MGSSPKLASRENNRSVEVGSWAMSRKRINSRKTLSHAEQKHSHLMKVPVETDALLTATVTVRELAAVVDGAKGLLEIRREWSLERQCLKIQSPRVVNVKLKLRVTTESVESHGVHTPTA